MEPVVMALIRGMVTVGAVACAVKGTAAPSAMRLWRVSHCSSTRTIFGRAYLCVKWKPVSGAKTKSLPSISGDL